MYPPYPEVTASLEPSAELASDVHHPKGAPVFVHVFPESCEILMAKSDAAMSSRPSAEQATTQLVLEPRLIVCQLDPELLEAKAWLIGNAPANIVPSAE